MQLQHPRHLRTLLVIVALFATFIFSFSSARPARIFHKPSLFIRWFSLLPDGISAEGEVYDRNASGRPEDPWWHGKGISFQYDKRSKSWSGGWNSSPRQREDPFSLNSQFHLSGSEFSVKEDMILKRQTGKVTQTYHLPPLSPFTFQGYRPLHHGVPWEMTPGFITHELLFPSLENGKIWFGIRFYEGEGGEGVGGLGFFDPDTESFGLLRLYPLCECSVEGLYQDSNKLFICTYYYSEGGTLPCSDALLWERDSGEVYRIPFPREAYGETEHHYGNYQIHNMIKTQEGYWFNASGGIVYADHDLKGYSYWKLRIGEKPELYLKEVKRMKLSPVARLLTGEALIERMEETVRKESSHRERDLAQAKVQFQNYVFDKDHRTGRDIAPYTDVFSRVQMFGASVLPRLLIRDKNNKVLETREGFFDLLILSSNADTEETSGVTDADLLQHQLKVAGAANLISGKVFILSPLPSGKARVVDRQNREVPLRRVKLKEEFYYEASLTVTEAEVKNISLPTSQGNQLFPVFKKVSLRVEKRQLQMPPNFVKRSHE